jgi:glycosyltransferase involved in cell wall biosynthesis
MKIDYNLTTLGEIQNDPYFEPYWKPAVTRITEFNAKNPSLFLFHDELSHQACGTPLLTLSMFETTKIKSKSFHMLQNGPTDVILTTTSKHKDILLENNITKPIEILRGGVDASLYNTITPSPHIDTKKFTFITVGKREKRKNTDIIIKSFIDNFKDKEVALIAHTFNMFINQTKEHPFKNLSCWTGINPVKLGFEYKGFIGNAHKFSTKTCDIYFTAPNIMTAEMPCLYHSADVGIQYSSGEGYGLPEVEMMACGLPTIISNCLGHSDFIRDLPVHKDLIIEPSSTEIARDGKWFMGDVGTWSIFEEEPLKDKLLEIYNNQDNYKIKSIELSNYIRNNFSWTNSVNNIKGLLCQS